ncbi:MAG TPA: SDR family NAD(P)-dependent oxidoreductase [Burkholderiales bacterium]|nr:SDR family NAD(P)-dependent oxidoreductase [Burkholderiales bacterium]
MKLTGKTAVITGAASGIGLATAQTFADAGASVVIGDINAVAGEQAVNQLKAAGHQAAFVPLDVTNDAAVARFRDAVYARADNVDVLVNVAGWSKIEAFVNTTPELWQKLIDLNYTGTLRVVHAFLPKMIARTEGKIVNVASDAGRAGSGGEAVYAGSKGAVIAFTKSLARETARYKLNVNCVCPGPTDTPLLASIPEKQREALMRAIPFRRFAKPAEVADAILFFASDRASYLTGQVLSVSGGLTMVD